MVITRIAPSPTGKFHIGSARTALFNYLFAKHNDGKFLLRIEDTDRARSSDEHVVDIKESLNWLGLHWDNRESEHYQSQRLEKYQEAASELVKKGVAYEKEGATYFKVKSEKLKVTQQSHPELAEGSLSVIPSNVEESLSESDFSTSRLAPAQTRQSSRGWSMSERESRRSVEMTDKNVKISDEKEPPTPNPSPSRTALRAGGQPPIQISFADLVHGQVTTQLENIEDFVILKSDGWPTYHLAVVVDDHDMEISHVIRGDDHLSNTPKHILLYRALDWQAPEFAHLPLILNANRTKMSKRQDPVSVTEDFQKQGFLPEAMINFLALLGWNPKTTQEIFTLDELIKKFELKNVQKSNAVFDSGRLRYFNAHYLRHKSPEQLLELAKPLWAKNYDIERYDEHYLASVLRLIVERAETVNDLGEGVNYFFVEPKLNIDDLVFKKSNDNDTRKGLQSALNKLDSLSGEVWRDKQQLADALASIVEENSLTNGDVFWPVRYALSGTTASPKPEELLLVLGKERAIKRIEVALRLIGL